MGKVSSKEIILPTSSNFIDGEIAAEMLFFDDPRRG
jgi:hypothetical protein